MTLQSSGAISLTDVLNEIRTVNAGRTNPISLGDSDVLALAGHAGPACTLSDLYGKTAGSGSTGGTGGSTGGGSTPTPTITCTDASATRQTSGIGTISCTSTATTTGLSGSITFAWTLVSGAAGITVSASGASCTFSKSVANGTEYDYVYQCQATDSNGKIATTQLSVIFYGYQGGIQQ